jgi:hypothetical protein
MRHPAVAPSSRGRDARSLKELSRPSLTRNLRANIPNLHTRTVHHSAARRCSAFLIGDRILPQSVSLLCAAAKV